MKTILAILLATALATTTPDITGIYEYKSIDKSKNHYIILDRNDGELKGKYFGTHDGKEHGLYFYKVDMRKLKIGDSGEIEFELGERWLYEETQFKIKDPETDSPMGRTGDILKFRGMVTGNKIKLTCNSEVNRCWDEELWNKELIFDKLSDGR